MKKTVANGDTAKRKRDRRITFGSVTVAYTEPDPSEIAKNIRESQKALERGLKAMLTPGVTLNLPDDVPRYHADPANPEYVIRVLNGVEERGTCVRGKFRACPK